MATKLAAREFKGNDRFQIEGTLGEGGMGVVYRARDVRRSRVVALKTMTRLDPAALMRFKREFRSLADIAHPGVVQLYELFAEGDEWFFTMELLEGVDFVSWVRRTPRSSRQLATLSGVSVPPSRPWVASEPTIDATLAPGNFAASPLLAVANSGARLGDLERLRAALSALAEGMRAIHRAGQLHRDIKPSNVMVTPEGRVVLLDFGVVGELHRASERIDESILGTPAYMAPEQARAARASPAADFYALGVMLYESLTGQLPFDGPAEEILHAKQACLPRCPREIVDGIPDDLAELCLDLLAPAADERPDADEVLERLRQATSRRSDSLPAKDASTTGTRRPFVGREPELALLRQLFRQSCAGQPVLLLVSGASGIGKSALIQRFLEEVAHNPRALVLSGRCYEREAVPFKGLDSAVDELSRWLSLLPQGEAESLLPRHAPELLRLFPALRSVPALERLTAPRAETNEPKELRRRAFMALRALLGAIADDRPLLVHLDDLQWADVDSLALLEQLLHAPGAPALLLLASFRAEALGKSPLVSGLFEVAERLSGGTRVERLELARLSREDSEHLARLALGSRAETAPELVRRIADEAQGSPLFVAELAAWQLRASTADAETGEPVSLDAVIHQRVEALPKAERALLEVLCVAGGPLEHSVVEALAGAGEVESLRARLRVARLTRTVESGDRELLDVYHGRIRDSLLGNLDPDRRRALHARLAGELESLGTADSEAMVEHFLAAGDDTGAARHVLAAAEAAEQGLAFQRAVRLYRSALTLTVACEPWEIGRKIGENLLAAGRGAEAAAAFASAVPHAPPQARTGLRRLAAEHFLKSGSETEGVRLLREALVDVNLSYPETKPAAVLSLVGNRARLLLRGIRFEPTESVAEATLERIDVAFAASSGLAMLDVVRAADFGARHLRLALDAGEPIRICRGLAIEASGRAAVEAGGRAGTERLVRTAESLATRSNDPHAIALAKLAAGLVRVFSGEWRAAQAILDEAEVIIRERCRGIHWELATAVSWSMNALILCGELKEAARRVPEVLREANERADRFALMYMVYPAAITAIIGDDPDTAERLAREFPRFGGEFSERFTGGHWGGLVSSVSVRRYRGQGRLAQEGMEVAFARIKASHFLRVHMMRVCTTFERGLCAISAAEDGAGLAGSLALAERCASALLSDKPDYAAPMGHHVRGCLFAKKGDRERAHAELKLAGIGLRRVDMGYLASCAEARAGALLGGDTGQAQVAQSREHLLRQGIVSVERCLEMSAPGFRGVLG